MAELQEDKPRRLLYTELDAQRVLFGLADKLAATVLQLAPVVALSPDRVHEMLERLQEVGLVESKGPGIGPYSGVYSLTLQGVRYARELRTTKAS